MTNRVCNSHTIFHMLHTILGMTNRVNNSRTICLRPRKIFRTNCEFIDGKEEFSIGPREWAISDVDGVDKVWLTGKGDLKQQPHFWDRHDHFMIFKMGRL